LQVVAPAPLPGTSTSLVVAALPQASPLFFGKSTAAVFTVRQVAAALRVSRATVYRLIAEGTLPAARVSSSYRILGEHVRALFHRGAQRAAGQL